VPYVHVALGAHAWPHAPQFAGSVFVFVGTPLQTVAPASVATSLVASPCGEASSSVVGAPIAQPTTMHAPTVHAHRPQAMLGE